MGCSQSKPNNNTLRTANRNFQRDPNTKTPATTNREENKSTHGNVVPPDTADEPNSVTLQDDTHHRAAAPTETHNYSSSCSSSLHVDVSTSHVNTSSDTSSDTSGNTTTRTPASTDDDGDRVRQAEPKVSNDSASVPSDLTSSFTSNEDLPLNAKEHRASSDTYSTTSDAPKPVTSETVETLSTHTDKTSNTPFETTSVLLNTDTVTVAPETNFLPLNNNDDVDSSTTDKHSTHAAETNKQTTVLNPNVTQLRSTQELTTFPEHSSHTHSFKTDTSDTVVSDKSSEDAVPALSNKSSSFSVNETSNNSVPPAQTTNAFPEPISPLSTTEQTFADSPRSDPTLHDPEPQEAILQNTEPHDLASPNSELQDPIPQDPTLHTAATTFITAANSSESVTSIQSAEEITTPTQQSTGGSDSELPNATPTSPTHSDDNTLLLHPYTQSHDDVESLEQDDTVGDDNAPLSWTEVTDQRLARSDNITLLRLRQPTAEHLNSIDEATFTTPNKTFLYPLSRIRQAPDSPPFCMFEDICSLGPVETVQNVVRNINSSVFEICSSLFP